jgi:hypothetical protein
VRLCELRQQFNVPLVALIHLQFFSYGDSLGAAQAAESTPKHQELI